MTNRGNYRQPIFGTDGAARSFQICLDEACSSHGWRVHAYSIMSNHFHLVLETPEPNLSDGMQWLQSTWAQRFNRYRGVTGRPFQGRFAARAECWEDQLRALARAFDIPLDRLPRKNPPGKSSSSRQP